MSGLRDERSVDGEMDGRSDMAAAPLTPRTGQTEREENAHS